MKRGRRPWKGVANTSQVGLPLEVVEIAAPQERSGSSSFMPDDPTHLFIGEKRLDVLLKEKGLGWVIRLRALLEKLDYQLLTVRYSTLGRRAYHPRTVLGLIMLGVLTRRFSLRDLEDESAANLGAWWICGGNQIDHSTIGKFVMLHAEALSDGFFLALTAQIVKELKLGAGVCGIDGTVMEAASSRFSALRSEAAALVAAEARKAAEAEPGNAAAERAAEHGAALVAKIEERAENRRAQGKDAQTVTVIATEPEALVQPRKDGVMRPGYKLSTLVHETGVILGQHVHPSSETASVEPLLDQHRALFDGKNPTTMLADANYFEVGTLRTAAEQNIDFLCPPGQTFEAAGSWEKKSGHDVFPKSAFQYVEAEDAYRCPAGELLGFRTAGHDRERLRYRAYGTRACRGCSLRTQCTRSKNGRRIKRYEGEEYKEAMRAVLANPKARQMYRRRMTIAEPVYAEFRVGLGLTRFSRRGLRGVRAESGLYSMALNLKRALYSRGLNAIGAISATLSRLKRLFALIRRIGLPRRLWRADGAQFPTLALAN